ncbi:MAG: hypothetical protein U0M60_05880 [Clostridia bacterium]|nr:hypothetical protein [Clostridia bacterium]
MLLKFTLIAGATASSSSSNVPIIPLGDSTVTAFLSTKSASVCAGAEYAATPSALILRLLFKLW